MSRTAIVLIPILVVICIRLPYVQTILRPLYTLVHEFSHALTALVLGNKIKEIEIKPDCSDSCSSLSKNKLRSFIVSLVGYTVPPILSCLILAHLTSSFLKPIFIVFTVFALIALVLYIRKTFATVWTIGLCMFQIAVLCVPWLESRMVYILYLYASVLLVESLFASVTLLYINLINARKAGDAYNLQKISHLPAIFYSVLFVGVSLWCIYRAFQLTATL